MPAARPSYALTRLDPHARGARRRESPTRYFRSLAEARREARWLNARDAAWGALWRWTWRKTSANANAGMLGF